MQNTPLTPTQTRALLEELGHRPRKNLGQNFLIDGNIVRKSLALGNVSPGDHAIEIGPGLGTLSQALLEAGASVHAIEYDKILADYLQRSLQPNYPEKFFLLQGDAVHHPLAGYSPEPGTPYKIIANLPYAITSHWLDHVLGMPTLPTEMVLMVQKEAATRLTAVPGNRNFSAISIFLWGALQKEKVLQVSKTCFFPVPKIDSVLIRLSRKDAPVIFYPKSKELIRQIFTQRRKQVAAHEKLSPVVKKWLQKGTEMGILNSTDRPEQIDFPAWQLLNDLATP